MNILERLRQLKTAALDRMEALNELAKKEGRLLSEAETLEYDLKKGAVIELNSAITIAETEFLSAEPAAVPADDPEDYYHGRRSLASMSITEWAETLRRDADSAQQ